MLDSREIDGRPNSHKDPRETGVVAPGNFLGRQRVVAFDRRFAKSHEQVHEFLYLFLSRTLGG